MTTINDTISRGTQRAEDNRPGDGFNLLQFRPVASVVRWPGFPAVFQTLVLGVFIALAVLGWGHYTPEGVNAKLYAKTNLVNFIIWGLWWPAIVWVTFLVGRAWCIVCPLELVSSQAEKLGGQLGVRQRPLRSWLARGTLVVLFFALLQMLVPGAQIHRVPHYTSLYLGTSLALAFAVGLFFKARAFCRGFCPVALLLSAYGRGGMLAVRPSNASCGQANAKAPNARACPSLLNPARLNTSKDCLVCGDCLKADTSGTMQLLVRPPWPNGDAREALASWALTLFVMIVSGFVTYELSGVANVVVPAKVLITSVVVFIVIPLTAGWLTRTALLKSHGKEWFEKNFLPKFHPVMICALLLTLVLIFAFQAENLTKRWLAVLLIAVPILIQVYFNSGLTYLLMWWFKVPHNVASPGALIGASNFFELPVAAAITLFGPSSGAALATVVGVLVEVPVMLSVCRVCNQSRPWYQRRIAKD